MKKSILSSKHTLIEHTAAEFAVVFYEAGRSSGLTSKHKTAKSWAVANYQKFIIPAVDHLTTLLGRNDISEHMKLEIYESLMERVNDPDVASVFPNPNLLPELDLKTLLENAPDKPTVIITEDTFKKSKKSRKNKLLEGISHG